MQAAQPAPDETHLKKPGCWKILDSWGPSRAIRRALRAIDPDLGDLEPAYRQHFLRSDADQTILGMLFLTVPLVILAVADYPFFGMSEIFLALVIGRLGLFGFCLATILRLRHIDNYRAYDRLLAIWIVGSGVALVVINVARPSTFTPPTTLYALIVLAVYLVMPNQLWHRVLLATFFTAFTIAVLVTGRRVPDEGTVNLISVSVILTNAMGVVVATRLSILRRREFLGRVALERARDELQVMATVDGLTGVFNRRRFLEIAADELERARRYARPLSVIAVDLDYFKTVNDRFGHAAGDVVLKVLAQILQGQTRRQDAVGRMGGEEFSIILPETSIGTAVALAERMRTQLRSEPVVTGDVTVTVTASLGVAEVAPSDRSVEDVLQRADRALYQAKHLGRDRVEAT
jgi:diguanylate cyclase (GGDEF)-like protein